MTARATVHANARATAEPARRRRRTLRAIAPLVVAGMLGCSPDGAGESSSPASSPVAERRIRVTATVGMVGDLVKSVGGDRVEVTTLMGPGVDPHLYKASEGDIARLSGADVVFYNGLFLEGKMGEVLGKIAERGRLTIPIAESVDSASLLHPAEFEGHPDPHVWFDVSLWMQTVPAVVDGLARIDPGSRAIFEANAAAHVAELRQLHEWCRAQLERIPAERRVLVTAHDAFGYFGRAYRVDVVGLQGLSTASEYGLRDVHRIVDVVTGRGVKAVFVESSVPPRSIEAVVEGCRAKGHEAVNGGELFSDAMGAAGTPEGTYLGMVRANVQTIVGALE